MAAYGSQIGRSDNTPKTVGFDPKATLTALLDTLKFPELALILARLI
jgi:hypothetical protein